MPFIKGQIFTEEHRKKLSLAKLGKPNLALLGKKRPGIGGVKKGNLPWNTGRKRPEMTGEKHWRWSGTTPLKVAIRHLLEYKQWRRTIYERDDFTCQLCSKRGGDLEADHFPVQFIHIFKEHNISCVEDAVKCAKFWDIDNGRTLCKPCHNNTKRKYG